MKRTLRLFAVIFAVMVAAAGIWRWSQSAPGRRAPALTFMLLDGGQLPMSALRGKPLLVVFWSITCAPCVREVPQLAAVYRSLHARGLDVVAVALPQDPPSLLADFSRRFKVPYPVAMDLDGAVARAYGGVTVIPRDILIGPDGRIVEDHVGPVDWIRMRAQVLGMLARGTAIAGGNVAPTQEIMRTRHSAG